MTASDGVLPADVGGAADGLAGGASALARIAPNEIVARLLEDRALEEREWRTLLDGLRADGAACDELRERMLIHEALGAALAPERRHFANRVAGAIAASADGAVFLQGLRRHIVRDRRRRVARRVGTAAAAAAVLAVLALVAAQPAQAPAPSVAALAVRAMSAPSPAPAAQPARSPLGRILTVAALGGQAEIVRSDGRRLAPAADLVLGLGDRVEIARSPDPADHGTRLVVSVPGATIDLAPGSILSVIGERAVALEAGRIFASVADDGAELAAHGRRLLVRTPDADVGVRGDRFELLADAASTLVRSEGVIEIRARGTGEL